MYERFSDPARRAMGQTQPEALRMGHESVGTEHILVALAGEPDGIAFTVLQSLNISADTIREQVARFVTTGPPIKMPETPWWMFWRSSRLPQTPKAKRIIVLAMEEVQAAGAKYVGSEHLLLGASRADDGIAQHVLRECGADRETLCSLIAERHRLGIREALS